MVSTCLSCHGWICEVATHSKSQSNTRLSPHATFALLSCYFSTSLMLSNHACASIIQRTHAYHEPNYCLSLPDIKRAREFPCLSVIKFESTSIVLMSFLFIMLKIIHADSFPNLGQRIWSKSFFTVLQQKDPLLQFSVQMTPSPAQIVHMP